MWAWTAAWCLYLKRDQDLVARKYLYNVEKCRGTVTLRGGGYRVHGSIGLPLNHHDLVGLLDLECVVEQGIGFVFFNLFGDCGYECRHL